MKPRKPVPPPPSATVPEQHPNHQNHDDWLCLALGRRLRELREQAGHSAYALAVPGLLSDQCILNNEAGLGNPGLRTLCRHCQRLGVDLRTELAALPAGLDEEDGQGKDGA